MLSLEGLVKQCCRGICTFRFRLHKLQQEMEVFLSTRRRVKVLLHLDETQELQEHIQSSLKIVAKQFMDLVKARDFLHKLHLRTTTLFESFVVLPICGTVVSQAVQCLGIFGHWLFCYLNFGFFKLNLILPGWPGPLTVLNSVDELPGWLLTETSVNLLFRGSSCRRI